MHIFTVQSNCVCNGFSGVEAVDACIKVCLPYKPDLRHTKVSMVGGAIGNRSRIVLRLVCWEIKTISIAEVPAS
jgi:hypothetical protein